MDQQDHSNDNLSVYHQTFTASTKTPSFRVEVDMRTNPFSTDQTSYTSNEGETRMCVESLRDDSHYRFQCRCGCGATFAGYGKDIRAAARVGGDITAFPSDPQIGDQWFNERTNTIYVCTDRNGDRPVWSKVETGLTTADYYDLKNAVDALLEEEPKKGSTEVFVSDRYLKKAQFDLSDEEIDAYAETQEDPLETRGVDLSRRQPPAIAAQVYSLSTGDGPLTLLDYKDQEIKVDGNKHRILSGVCRSQKGRYVTLPLADLTIDCPARNDAGVGIGLLALAAMMLASSVAGSLAGIVAKYYLF